MNTGRGQILYHGSYCEVAVPDLGRCAGYKDFGRGFYLTTSRRQAERFALTSLRKAVSVQKAETSQQYGIVSVFEVLEAQWNGLDVCRFETADAAWLRCVVGHRRRDLSRFTEPYRCYDVIAGKIANDATNATITAYMAGVYGPVGSGRAEELCISFLLPDRLRDQYCFRTERALASLCFLESVRYEP